MLEYHSTLVGDVYCGFLDGGTNENVQELESQDAFSSAIFAVMCVCMLAGIPNAYVSCGETEFGFIMYMIQLVT
jgi:hypothetical protein